MVTWGGYEMPSETTPTLAAVLRAALAAARNQIHVSLPGEVTSYNASKRSADVKPLIKRGYEAEDGSRAVESLSVLAGIPVAFPGSGGFDITWPLSAGDTGLIVFSEASIDRWLARGGGEQDPGDDRRHSFSDAIFIPGLRSFGDPGTGADGSNVVIKTASEIHAGGSQALALNSDLQALISVLKTWVVAAHDGGAALQTAINAAFGSLPGGTTVLKGS